MSNAKTAILAASLSLAPAVQAGIYSDDLSKCLVESTTPADRVALVRWLFVAAAAHPAVASIASVSPKDLDEANKTTAALFMRLLTDSCKDKAKNALNFEGPVTLTTSFQVLGQVAGREMFSSPEVTKAMSGLEKYTDVKKLEALKTRNPAK
jgi:hypothetical protein